MDVHDDAFGFRTPANPERIADILGRIAQNRREMQSASDDKERWRAAMGAFRWGQELLIEAVGLQALSEVYGDDPDEDAPLSDHLSAVARRLFNVTRLFPSENPSAKSSLRALKEEIQAVAHGDLPRIVVPSGSRGRPTNAYRIARHQLLALEWDITLQTHLGKSIAESHNAVSDAYGETWTTISRWDVPVARELGQASLDEALAAARRMSWLAELGNPMQLLRKHGAEYRDELRRRVFAVQ